MNAVFITGASSGLGAALAREYAAQGARVALLGRRQDALEAVRASMIAPDKHTIYVVDVCDASALAHAAQDFINKVGVVNVVIASAGVSVGTLTQHHEDAPIFEKVIATNVLATTYTFAPFIQHMQSKAHQHTCRLVGIASVAGIRGLPGAGAYSASKAAVISYCESLRVELGPEKIKVVTIAPGYIDTAMTQVNDYKMPFLMPAEQFAKQAVQKIQAGTSYCVIPWQMAAVAKVLRVLPNTLYDYFFTNAPRKKRQSSSEK
jgi:short-subunit dehydrogenase